jgi:hypothetical protein
MVRPQGLTGSIPVLPFKEREDMSAQSIRCGIPTSDTHAYSEKERQYHQDADNNLFWSPISPKPQRSKLGSWYSVDRTWIPDRGTHIGQSGRELPGTYIYSVVINNDIERDAKFYKGPFDTAMEARKAYRKIMEPYIK